MDTSILQLGIDFSQKRAEVCLLDAEGRVLDQGRRFANSAPGYQQAKQYLLQVLHRYGARGVDIAGEATSYYWLPFFWQLAHDQAWQGYQVRLFLLNARQVAWFKRSYDAEDKSDVVDAYYIAERLRTRRRKFPWRPQEAWLGLRFYTRLRFHLGQMIAREKNYLWAHLFLKYSAYGVRQPFADAFGATSQRLLQADGLLAEWQRLPLEELAQRLDELSQHHLPHPLESARKLRRTLEESFPPAEPLIEPLQRLLEVGLAHLNDLQTLARQVEGWIAQEVDRSHPEVRLLADIKGLGIYLAAGIAAEIGDLERFFAGQKWDKQRRRYRRKNLRDVEDTVARYAGLWWPRRNSGDFQGEERRLSKRGNRYLRYYLVEAANKLRRFVPEYGSYYARKYREARRHRHKRALVLTARKSVGLFVGLLHRKEPYRPKEGRQATH